MMFQGQANITLMNAPLEANMRFCLLSSAKWGRPIHSAALGKAGGGTSRGQSVTVMVFSCFAFKHRHVMACRSCAEKSNGPSTWWIVAISSRLFLLIFQYGAVQKGCLLGLKRLLQILDVSRCLYVSPEVEAAGPRMRCVEIPGRIPFLCVAHFLGCRTQQRVRSQQQVRF